MKIKILKDVKDYTGIKLINYEYNDDYDFELECFTFELTIPKCLRYNSKYYKEYNTGNIIIIEIYDNRIRGISLPNATLPGILENGEVIKELYLDNEYSIINIIHSLTFLDKERLDYIKSVSDKYKKAVRFKIDIEDLENKLSK
jgi:hypothetical protein